MSLEVRHMQRQVTERATDGQRNHLFVLTHRDRILVVGVAAKEFVGAFARKHDGNVLAGHLGQEPQRHGRQVGLRLVHVILDVLERTEELVGGDHLANVLDAELIGKLLGVVGLVEILVVKAHREGLVGHKASGDVAGVDATGEERRDLDIGDAMGLDALVHDLVQLVDILFERLLDGRVIAIPVALDVHLAGRDIDGKVVRRRQLVDTLEEGLLSRRILQRHVRTQSLFVDRLVEVRVVQEALDLGTKEHARSAVARIGHGIVVKRLDAKDVAGAKKLVLLFVPDDEGVHTAQAIEDGLAPLLVAVQEALGVGAAVELVALGLELGTEFLEVVDLAVEDNDDAAVLVGHGLSAGLGQVEDRQAAEAQGNAAVDKLTAHVGTAMDDAVHHLGEHLGLVIRPTDKTDKTAHILSPLLLLGIKSNQ